MTRQFEIDAAKSGREDTKSDKEINGSLASQILLGDQQSSGSSMSGKSDRNYDPKFEGPKEEKAPYIQERKLGPNLTNSSFFGNKVEEEFFDKWDANESGDLSKQELSSARDNSARGSAENSAAELLVDNFKEATDMATAMNPILLSRLTGDFFGAPLYEKNFGNDWKWGISRKDLQAMDNARYRLSPSRVYESNADIGVMFGSTAVSVALAGAAAMCNVVPQLNAYRFPLIAAAFAAQVPLARLALRSSQGLFDDQVRTREDKLNKWFQNYANKHN